MERASQGLDDWMLAAKSKQSHHSPRPIAAARQARPIDSQLGDSLRASGINSADVLAVQTLYATAGQIGSHRIVSALQAIGAWLREGGAK